MEIGDEIKINWNLITRLYTKLKPCVNKENKYIVQNITKSGISAYFIGNPVRFCQCPVCKDLKTKNFSCMGINSLRVTRSRLSVQREDKINTILNEDI
jgi:hypothetical protein